MMPLIPTTVTLAVLYFLTTRVQNNLRLRHIPGPFLSRLTHIPLMRLMLNGTVTETTHSLHMQYGPVVLLSPDYVSLSDPDEMRRLNGVRSNWNRGPAYTGM